MGDFFHGWRRKTGLLTLVLACMTTSAWLSCLFHHDLINRWIFNTYSCNDGDVSLFTDGNSISLITCEDITQTPPSTPTAGQLPDVQPTTDDEQQASQDDTQLTGTTTSRLTTTTTTFGVTQSMALVPIVETPFWIIVAPLIAVSACLLLTKSQPTKAV